VSDMTPRDGDVALLPAAIAGVGAVCGVEHAPAKPSTSHEMSRFIRSSIPRVREVAKALVQPTCDKPLRSSMPLPEGFILAGGISISWFDATACVAD
jgi:hypothetical protein